MDGRNKSGHDEEGAIRYPDDTVGIEHHLTKIVAILSAELVPTAGRVVVWHAFDSSAMIAHAAV